MELDDQLDESQLDNEMSVKTNLDVSTTNKTLSSAEVATFNKVKAKKNKKDFT